jgi:flap endonuclease-1
MGVLLTPIVVKDPITLADLRGKQLAVDANGELYQFLALIRLPDGTPLRDSQGRITSHLSGLFFRTTRLIADFGMRVAFVFDGRPPVEKTAEITRRRTVRERYEVEAAEARRAGDFARAYSKSTMTSRLTPEMVAGAKELLRLMGLPVIQARSEAEAQAAYMARRGDVWAAASKDYDALLFGAPRLVRFLTISGREFLPAQRTFRPITPELIDVQRMLDALGITHPQLIDLGLLVGTDFHPGVNGIGPKKALALVKRHGAIEHMPSKVRDSFVDLNRLRQIYLDPEVHDDYNVASGRCDADGVVHFLCDEHAFGRDRVMAALERAFGSQRLF